MQALTQPLYELAEYEELQKNKREAAGVIQISGCVNSQKSHFIYALSDGCKYKVIACSSESKARQVYEELFSYIRPRIFYFIRRILGVRRY